MKFRLRTDPLMYGPLTHTSFCLTADFAALAFCAILFPCGICWPVIVDAYAIANFNDTSASAVNPRTLTLSVPCR